MSKLVQRIDHPQDRDRAALAKYGEKAFRLLLPIAKSRIADFNRSPHDEGRESRVDNVLWPLTECASRGQTKEVTRLYASLDPASKRGRWTLFSWLAYTGDPAPNRSLFAKALSEGSRQRERDYFTTQMATASVRPLVELHDPASVTLMARVLMDPQAVPDVRHTLYFGLAKTGSPAALSALDKCLDRGRTLPPLAVRHPLPTAGEAVKEPLMATYRDRKGTLWGLMQWAGFANEEDLWRVRRSGTAWVDPVFTGVSLSWPRWLPSGRQAAGYEAHDKEIHDLIEGGGWVARFVTDTNVEKDSDGDGYSDVVERWLGLNPGNRDCDGDGILDGVDKNPFAASRKLNETERVLVAAFDAVTALRDLSHEIFVEFPAGVQPIELDSFPGLVLPRESPFPRTRKEALYGLGIRLGAKKGPAAAFAKDGQTAEVEVQESGGYYETASAVRLKRFGSRWYPVGSRMLWSAVS